ncbi:hypothetical protein OF83DRAFT_810763 [Amylostereum chailletii]|nr:hypothetical protein OF83DRAFT_810763 [Amylostereum chailletii]
MSWTSGTLWNVVNDISSMRTVTGLVVSAMSLSGYVYREKATAAPLLSQAQKVLADINAILGSLSPEEAAQIAVYQMLPGHHTVEDLEERYQRFKREYDLHKFEYNNATRWQRWWIFSMLCQELNTLIDDLKSLSDDVYRSTTYPTHLRVEDRRAVQRAERAERREAQIARVRDAVRRVAGRVEQAGTELELVNGPTLPAQNSSVTRMPSARVVQAQRAIHMTARSGQMPWAYGTGYAI